MNNRLSRIMTRWMKHHPTHGIVPMSAGVVMDDGDEDVLLVDGARLPVTVYNDVDDPCMIPRYNPDQVPAIAIIPQVSLSVPVDVRRGQMDFSEVDVSFSYLERDTTEILARRRGGYMITAMVDSLLGFNKPELSNMLIPGGTTTWRRLGDIEVLEVKALEEVRMTIGLGTASMFGSLIATFRVRRVL